MVALRSRRLESVLGATLDALAASHIHGLVPAGIQESFDLDFKATLYGRTDSDKRALAGDVAALANTGGGIIVLGVEENEQARATKTPGVQIADAEVARMRQIVASLVAPMPVIDILAVADTTLNDTADGTAHGFIIVAVPRSPGAPHAVLINDGMRFPMRNGATTRYLSEPEVATAYRNRFASFQRQVDRVDLIEREAVDRLAGSVEYAWLIVSLVPDLPGAMHITREAFQEFETDIRRGSPTVIDQVASISRTRVWRQRLLADGTSNYEPESRWISMELHTDGSGVFAVAMGNLREREMRRIPGPEGEQESQAPLYQLISDESIAAGILSGLLQLGRHARDRAAAGGTALIRAQLHPVNATRPTTIGHSRGFGFRESRTGEQYQTATSPCEVAAPVDDLAQPGPALVAAAALLLDELGHGFGVPEMGQLSRDGQVRRKYWGNNGGRQTAVTSWAKANGIEVTDETI